MVTTKSLSLTPAGKFPVQEIKHILVGTQFASVSVSVTYPVGILKDPEYYFPIAVV